MSIFILCFFIGGCAFIFREDNNIKISGINLEQAQEIIKDIDEKPENEKVAIWPRKQSQ